MKCISRQLVAKWGVIIWVLFATASQALCQASAPPQLHGRERIFHAIAERGNAGTVGIYCRHDHPDEAYYGTGAIISKDGYILTSTTVVPPGSKDIEIYFTDRRRRDAVIVEIHEALETTLLKVDGISLKPLPVSRRSPQVGDRAYTLGNAFNMIRLGEQATFSAGRVSGVYRVKSADNQSAYTGLAIETDAAINPGQDGGPLLDPYGRLIGIISLGFSDMRWQGMAVPMTLIESQMAAIRDGRVQLVRDPMGTPPKIDLAEGSPLARLARAIRPTLVAIHVERRFPPQRLPSVFVWDYLRNDPRFSPEIDAPVRQRALREIIHADQLLNANRQLRRPAGPVTGVLISSQGHVLTSYFNVMPDRLLTNRKGRVPKVEFKGELADIQVTSEQWQKQRVEANPALAFRITLADGREFEAKLLANNQVAGVSLLQITNAGESESFPFLSLADRAARPTRGEAVAVIGIIEDGEPDFTFNTGIVSVPERNRGQGFQLDASLNYGNSGGPVFNRAGGILGIATAPMNPGPVIGHLVPSEHLARWPIAPNGGIGFAAPTHVILASLPTLKAGENIARLERAYLGVSPSRQDILTDRVIVGAVVKTSPAGKAGIRVGDQIVSVDGGRVTSWRELMAVLDDHEAGDTLSLRVLRQGSPDPLDIDLVLEDAP